VGRVEGYAVNEVKTGEKQRRLNAPIRVVNAGVSKNQVEDVHHYGSDRIGNEHVEQGRKNIF
jgi:hypothetical protein